MDLLVIAEASIKLGMPMAVFSWLMFSWLHSEGKLDITADRKTLSQNMKQMRSSQKKEQRENKKKARADKKKESLLNSFASKGKQFMQMDEAVRTDPSDNANFVFNRWMKFGGGFYGLAGLWTFVVVETLDIFRFLFHPEGLARLFEQSIIKTLVDFIVNQFENLLSAFLWFNYWSDRSTLSWVLIAYLGYWIGIQIARRKI